MMDYVTPQCACLTNCILFN